MSIFTTIEGWFKKEQVSVNKLFTRIEPLIAKAEPIVKALSLIAAGVATSVTGTSALMGPISAFLTKTVGVTSVVDNFVKVNEAAPLNSVLLNAGSLALQYTHGTAATLISDFDTATQIAYAAVKEQGAAAAVVATAPVVATK